MVKEILKLKTDNGKGEDNPSFKNIEIGEYTFKSPRMGVPTLTAELMWPTCLDSEWTRKEYVMLRGEKYYVRQAQTSEISNDNVIKYKHSIEFSSEREQLSHVYFYDVVPSWSATYDRPNTNSTKFCFFGTIYEFADRLNCALRYAGIGDSILKEKTSLTDKDEPVGDGYCVVVSDLGDGDLEQSQEVSFEDQWLWDALATGFEKYEIPFSFHGKKIVFNEYIEPIDHVFKYGFDESLLSVKKENANAKIINRITFKGSSENIPYHYPCQTEYGFVKITALEANKYLTKDDFYLFKPNRLVGRVMSESPVTLGLKASADAEFNEAELECKLSNKSWGVFGKLKLGNWYKIGDLTEIDEYHGYTYRIPFSIQYGGDVTLKEVLGLTWDEDTTPPYNTSSKMINIIGQDYLRATSLVDSAGNDYLKSVTKDGDRIVMAELPAGSYILDLDISWVYNGPVDWWRIDGISFDNKKERSFYWQCGDNKTSNLLNWGIELLKEPTEDMIGDGFMWEGTDRMTFQENLMPPKYRETLGTERFYNALNNTYLKSDGKTYYTFKNPYIEGNPNEYIYSDEEIKPTIEGVTNKEGELYGVIAGIAFDSDDNDSLKGNVDSDEDDAANYAHSFFYIKLNRFDSDGDEDYSFDLFKCASQTDPMTIQMTSGKCNGCKFKIQIVETSVGDVEEWANPVQTSGKDGNIIDGGQAAKINKNNIQEWQQDTSKNYIWIAVQKDVETFGVIMPNRTNNYLPEVGDTFNIINIDLPQVYVTSAEKRGEYAMLDFLEENNEEKFNFSITASRIFFAENPDILDKLDENSRIKVEYDGRLYELYVSEFGIDCKKNEALPDVQLSLTETLESTGSFVEEVVAKAVGSMGNLGTGKYGSSTGGLSTESADSRYLRKDKDERTPYRVTSDDAFQVGDFQSGSKGGIMFVDPETGQSTIEVDYIKARIKAAFETLEIAHVRSIGGKMVITPGGSIDISFVEELEDSYRCYFKQKETDQGANCRFVVGDDVICQSFNVANGKTQNASNKYYWRRVVAVSNEGSYVELSKSDCATGSDAPEIGDTICQLGSTDTTRQSAIILSTVDDFSPNITLYDNVTEFSLADKEVVEMGVDQTSNNKSAFFHVYGDAYVGDKDGASYLRYSSLVKELEVKAKLSVESSVGDDSLADYIQSVSPPVKQEDIEDFVNNIVKPQLQDIQDQIDGVIETWFGEGEPTLANEPAKDWTTTDLKDQHTGDLYYDNLTGRAYRFSYDETLGDYCWIYITDEAIAKALAAAKDAQDTADGKRRVFTALPAPPYDKGDLWVNVTYPDGITPVTRKPENGKYYQDILRCETPKADGEFSIDDWVLSSAYTDDTTANEALTQIAGYEYLKKALQNSTQIDGGLIMTSLITLGYSDTDGTRHTLGGMNGTWLSSLGGRTIGSWWGGPMTDLFNKDDVNLGLAAGEYATALVRMDGSAYFANGNIGFKKDGSGWLGNQTSGIKFDTTGALTVGSGMTIDVTNVYGLKDSLESIANWQLSFNNFFVPCDSNGNELSWQDAMKAEGTGLKGKYLKAKVTLCSTGDLVAYKDSDFSGGGTSGGGLDLDALENYLKENNYATEDWVTAHFNNYVLTKAAVESVLTGNITSHTHSQYLTSASLDNYVTLDTIQTISGPKTFSTDVVATKFVKQGGTNEQLLMADGDVVTKKTVSAVANLGFTSDAVAKTTIPTMSVLAYWNGRYNDNSSNLQYCFRGFFGTIVTASKDDYLLRSGGSMLNTNLVTNLNAQYLNGSSVDAVRGYRVKHPTVEAGLGVGAAPFNALGMQTGSPLFDDPEFSDGLNGCAVYNNKGNGNITVERITDDQLSANSSGNIIKITCKGEAAPQYGGFSQIFRVRANAIFMHIIRAKIPVGRYIQYTANNTGTLKTRAAITENAGTGKWEWYAHMVYCGDSGSFAQSGFFYVNNGDTPTEDEPLEWYVSHAQVWDLTKNNYGAFRAKFTDALSVPRNLWGQTFDGTSDINGSIKMPYGSTEYLLQATANGVSLGVDETNAVLVNASGNVGIGTTAPGCKLDVNGLVNANGYQFVGTTGKGWYYLSQRICAGTSAALSVSVGSLLVSNVWSDSDKVPSNGVYTKGAIRIGDGTITWDATNNTFVFSHTVVSKGDLVAYKEEE